MCFPKEMEYFQVSAFTASFDLDYDYVIYMIFLLHKEKFSSQFLPTYPGGQMHS